MVRPHINTVGGNAIGCGPSTRCLTCVSQSLRRGWQPVLTTAQTLSMLWQKRFNETPGFVSATPATGVFPFWLLPAIYQVSPFTGASFRWREGVEYRIRTCYRQIKSDALPK